MLGAETKWLRLGVEAALLGMGPQENQKPPASAYWPLLILCVGKSACPAESAIPVACRGECQKAPAKGDQSGWGGLVRG